MKAINVALLVLLCALLWSTPPPARAQDEQALTPELKEIKAALEIKDPAQQLDALARYLTNYPNSRVGDDVRSLYLQVLFERLGKQKAQVLLYVNKLLEATPADSKAEVYNDVADRLINANIAPEKAEEYATRGLQLLDEQLQHEAQARRAVNLATLGEAYLKLGKTAEAKKALIEALQARPTLLGAPVALAQIESAAGNYQAALNYLIAVTLTGRISADGRALLLDTYRKLHDNSLNGLDAMLDAEYEQRYPNPIKIESYKTTPARSDRLVLTELFGSASCPPCQAADLALDAALKRYARTDMIVLMYHLNLPRPDPMTNAATEARGEFYNVESTPTTFIDGQLAVKGGGARDEAVEFYKALYPKLDERLAVPARAQLRLEATQQGATIRVRATAGNIKSPSNTLKLQIALVEDVLRYSGESSIRFHPMVVRSLANAVAGGFDLNATEPKAVEYTFDVNKINTELQTYLEGFEKENGNTFWDKKLPVNADNLSVVAFVQDTRSKQILQAAFIKPKTGGGPVAANQ